MISCPSCGRENHLSGVFCKYCSADLVPAAGSAQQSVHPPGTHSELPLAQEVEVGAGILAVAQADTSVHIVLSAQTRRGNAMVPFCAGVLFLVAGIAVLLAAITGQFSGSSDQSIGALKGSLLGAAFALGGVLLLFLARDTQHGRKWVVRHGSLEITRSSFGKTKTERYTSGVLRIKLSGGIQNSTRDLVIEHGGKTNVVFDSPSALRSETVRRLGKIIAHETGFEFIDKEPEWGSLLNPFRKR